MGLEQQAVPGVEQFEQKAQADPPVRGVSLSQPGRRVFARQSRRKTSVPATLDSPVAVPGWSAEVTREAIHIWEHTRAPGPSPRNSLIISPPGIR